MKMLRPFPVSLSRYRTWLVLIVSTSALLTAGSCASGPESPELARQVEIRRTAYGVPHITGESLAAVAFGLGFCQAEDHLVNIMERMLVARGELAKSFGPGEERGNVESDFWNRQFEVRSRAEATYDQLDADFRSMLEGFAGGLNYYVELHRHELPDWIPTLDGRDVAAHGLTGVMRFAFNRGRIVESFRESRIEHTTLIGDDPPSDVAGSNMWALAPERTASGHAILMGNPHQAWSQVATYYEAHLVVPGELNFYGSTFVGRPVLTTGFNEHLGWSHTVNYPDLEEIYALERDPERPDHYLLDDSSHAMTGNEVTVEIQSPDGSVETETRSFLYTDLGPVIDESAEQIFVLKSAVYDEFRFYQQWLRLEQATDFEEFMTALEIQAIPMFNIVYADRDGNIFYLWNGTVPVLPHESHRAESVTVAKSSEIWSDIHPLDELPQQLNPAGGYVQNSNDPPYFTNLHQPMEIDDFPAHFPRHRLGLRTQHGLELLHNEREFTLEDSRDTKFSLRMLLADRVKEDLIAAVRAGGGNEQVQHAASLLEEWDNSVAAESRGSVLFKEWWSDYAFDGRTQRTDLFAEAWTPDSPTSTPRGLADRTRAVEAFERAVEATQEKYGAWDVAWGDVHRVRVGDVDLPVGGCSGSLGCFRVLSFRQDDDGKQVVRGGDSWIFTVEFSEPPRAYSVVGYSESEVAGSPHEADQTELYANNTMKRVAFTDQEIEAELVRRYRPGDPQ